MFSLKIKIFWYNVLILAEKKGIRKGPKMDCDIECDEDITSVSI